MPPPSPRAPTRRRAAVLAVCLGILAALAVAELALRLLDLPRLHLGLGFLGPFAGNDLLVADRQRFWKLEPAKPWVNELGLRGWLPATHSIGDGSLRVACFGDSCTYGSLVRLEEAYPMVLERLLREALPNRRIETIVAGVPGYSSWQNRTLFADSIAAFAPDVTVLYVGGWNDYVPALGPDDRHRVASTRLFALLRQATLRTPSAAEQAALWGEFRADDARLTRRVPLDDFIANLRAMIELGRRGGGTVLVVSPPLDPAMLAATPIAARYRAAIAAVASAAGVPLLDAPGAFAAARASTGVQPDYTTTWPCLLDWVHPSPLGHRLIAEGLVGLLQQRGALVDAPPRPAPEVTAVEQRGDALLIRGAGFATLGVDRVFLGPYWLADASIAEPQITAKLPPGLPPGTYPVGLVGRFGWRRLTATAQVPATPLRGRAERRPDGGLRVDFEVDGPPGWTVQLWLAPERGPAQVTQHGVFELPAPQARPAGSADTPFVFEAIQLTAVAGNVAADGTWKYGFELDPAAAAGLSKTVWLQAGVIEPAATGRAALSAPLELRTSGH